TIKDIASRQQRDVMILNECHDCHREVEMDTAERNTVLWSGEKSAPNQGKRKVVGNKTNARSKKEKDLSDLHN
ncbi:hypothetical protein Tco_0433931, partial [Tanacetum coccineum]